MQLGAFTFAWSQLPKRRLLAVLVTAAVHAGLFALIFSARGGLPDSAHIVTDIILIAELEPEPLQEELEPVLPEVEVPSEPDPQEPVIPDDAAPVANLPAPPPPVSARAGEPDSEAPDSADAYPLSPGTRSVLQGLQCPGNREAFARTGTCPQGAGRHTTMVAADESASEFYSIDVSAIRAMFGVSPHALSGQATLDGGTQRRSLANSDSIRDALPASQPDPAFGD